MSTYTFKDAEVGTTITVLSGPEQPKPDGYGGWQEQARPKDKAFVNWQGAPLARLTLDCMIDGFSTGTSVETDVNYIKSWGRYRGEKTKQPTTLYVTGILIKEPTTTKWVIDGLSWGDAISSSDGTLLRQQVTVALMEYEAPDLLKVKSVGASYKTKKGDTLKKIASKQLGNSKRWTEIRDLNPKKKLRNPRKRLKAGQILKMPLL